MYMPGPLADRIETLEDLDVLRAVAALSASSNLLVWCQWTRSTSDRVEFEFARFSSVRDGVSERCSGHRTPVRLDPKSHLV